MHKARFDRSAANAFQSLGTPSKSNNWNRCDIERLKQRTQSSRHWIPTGRQFATADLGSPPNHAIVNRSYEESFREFPRMLRFLRHSLPASEFASTFHSWIVLICVCASTKLPDSTKWWQPTDVIGCVSVGGRRLYWFYWPSKYD